MGWEPDISAQWTPHAPLQFSVSYARLIPGAFLREAAPGVAYNYSYCFPGYRFRCLVGRTPWSAAGPPAGLFSSPVLANEFSIC